MDAYNALIIGSGPAGLFAAMQLERLGLDRIAIIDRHPYPAGGLLNDGKLNFDYRVGMDLDELKIDRDSAQHLMEEIRQVFIHFPKCQQVTFVDKNKTIEALGNIAKEHDAQFIAPEQWHWGTDNGKAVVDYLRNHLKKTEFLLGTAVTSVMKHDDDLYHVSCSHHRKKVCYAAKVVLAAPGRSGAYWFRDVATKLHVRHNFGPIDVGIRIELNRKYYDAVTDIVYDPKFIFR
ncbi:MAG: NAD(P)/FAD-dependent oxidoreductase, partial [Proteobacteria bacterium]|nr:NAD(P)/FAD-dependent oxidoreductase [Pseudomonadota bacterium]